MPELIDNGYNSADRRASGTDHDLIVELTVEMRNVRSDIKELKDGTASRISSLEDRVEKLELGKENNRQRIEETNRYTKIIVAIGVLIVGIFVYHISGYHI